MHPFLEFDGFLAFAHRGGAEEAPENTMAAFEAAVNLGYRYLETDAYTTLDGTLLSFHDTMLDRVTDRVGDVSEMAWDEVKQARVGGVEPIPLMAEVLGAWPDVRVNIDPKVDTAVGPLIKLIKDMDVLDRVCIGSFSSDRIKAFRDEFGSRVCTSMGPGQTTRLRAAAFHVPTGSFEANCAQLPLTYYGLTVVDARMVRAVNRLGLQLHVWTIDERSEMERMIDLGVHGLMTDRPSLLKEVLEGRGLWRT